MFAHQGESPAVAGDWNVKVRDICVQTQRGIELERRVLGVELEVHHGLSFAGLEHR